MNDIDTGALGASGRFARMEAALDRIELKLDLKADASRVVELESKLTSLDHDLDSVLNGTRVSPRISMAIERLTELEKAHHALVRQLDDLTSGRATSPLSAMYLERFSGMEKSVERLEESESNRAAILASAKEKADAQIMRLSIVVGAATIGNMIFSFIMNGSR